MPDKPKDYSNLPNWPRLMPADLACRYVGWSRTGFVGLVGKSWPEPIRSKVLWDKKTLDEAVDRLSEGVEPLVDPFMAAFEDVGTGAEPAADAYLEAIRGVGKQTGKRKGRRRR